MKQSVPALEAMGLGITLDGQPILNNLDCIVPAGSVTALVGPNGAGKSTLLQAFASILEPGQGTLKLDGKPFTAITRRQRAQRIAWVEQMPRDKLGYAGRHIAIQIFRPPNDAPPQHPGGEFPADEDGLLFLHDQFDMFNNSGLFVIIFPKDMSHLEQGEVVAVRDGQQFEAAAVGIPPCPAEILVGFHNAE